jgi:predicted alpha/beta-fold hydrolase
VATDEGAWVGEPTTFRALFGLRSAHVQTVLGPYLPGKRLADTIRFTVDLEDGDSVSVHANGLESGVLDAAPVVLISVHGLAGCHRSRYMERLAWYVCRKGWLSYRMDMRGAGDSGLQSRFLYHAGRSDDLGAVVAFVRQRHPAARIFLCGFSLGASVALLLVSDHSAIARYQLSGAIAVCPPLDLGLSADHLQLGWNKVYDRVFAKALWRSLQERPNAVRELGDRMPARRPPTLKAFDQMVTAPLGGFPSAEDYYARFSAGPLVRKIRIPTLVIMAKDDPLIPYEVAERTEWSPAMKIVATERGGHLGFIGSNLAGPSFSGVRWVEQAIVHAIEQQLQVSNVSNA